MKILVTGASGFIGSHLVQHLVQNPDNKITGLDKIRLPGFEGDEFHIFDLDKIENISDDILSQNVIVHLAGDPESFGTNTSKLSASTKSTAEIINKAIDKNVRKFIYISSTKALEKTDYGKAKLEAENILIEKCKNNRMNFVIFRCGPVFGQGMKSGIAKFVKTLVNFPTIEFPVSNAVIPLLGIYDLSRCIEFCIQNDNLDDDIYYLSDNNDYSVGNIQEIVQRRNKRKANIKVPGSILKLLAKVGDLCNWAGIKCSYNSASYNTLYKQVTGVYSDFWQKSGMTPQQNFYNEIETLFLEN